MTTSQHCQSCVSKRIEYLSKISCSRDNNLKNRNFRIGSVMYYIYWNDLMNWKCNVLYIYWTVLRNSKCNVLYIEVIWWIGSVMYWIYWYDLMDWKCNVL